MMLLLLLLSPLLEPHTLLRTGVLGQPEGILGRDCWRNESPPEKMMWPLEKSVEINGRTKYLAILILL